MCHTYTLSKRLLQSKKPLFTLIFTCPYQKLHLPSTGEVSRAPGPSHPGSKFEWRVFFQETEFRIANEDIGRSTVVPCHDLTRSRNRGVRRILCAVDDFVAVEALGFHKLLLLSTGTLQKFHHQSIRNYRIQ